jgi:hypothetical protein
MLLFKKPYVFFTLFGICWIILLAPVMVSLFSISAGSAVSKVTIELEIICFAAQYILGIIYLVSLYKTRKLPHTKRLYLNIVTILLVIGGFLLSVDGALMMIWAATR